MVRDTITQTPDLLEITVHLSPDPVQWHPAIGAGKYLAHAAGPEAGVEAMREHFLPEHEAERRDDGRRRAAAGCGAT